MFPFWVLGSCFVFVILFSILCFCFGPIGYRTDSLRNPNISDKTRDALNVCVAPKGGTVLNTGIRLHNKIQHLFSGE